MAKRKNVEKKEVGVVETPELISYKRNLELTKNILNRYQNYINLGAKNARSSDYRINHPYVNIMDILHDERALIADDIETVFHDIAEEHGALFTAGLLLDIGWFMTLDANADIYYAKESIFMVLLQQVRYYPLVYKHINLLINERCPALSNYKVTSDWLEQLIDFTDVDEVYEEDANTFGFYHVVLGNMDINNESLPIDDIVFHFDNIIYKGKVSNTSNEHTNVRRLMAEKECRNFRYPIKYPNFKKRPQDDYNY